MTLKVGTHGGPYIRSAEFRLVSKDTRRHVPIITALAAIESFLQRKLRGQSLTEVSGWDVSKTAPVDIGPSPRRAAAPLHLVSRKAVGLVGGAAV